MDVSFRVIGHRSADDGRYARVVDKVVIHRDPLSFRALAEEAIPPDTRYLVMDLDRTVHRGRNMGELLGFELIAYHAYGMEQLEAAEPRRRRARFFLDTTRWSRLLKYMWLGVALWAYPGLYYLMWCKLAVKRRWSRRWSYRRFGPEPVSEVQRVPQTALLSQLAAVPLSTLRSLSRRVWRRYEPDQVITAADVAWLRQRCPHITILLASASPQPMLEVAAEELGVDAAIYSSTEEHEGYLSAPFWLKRLVSQSLWPRRIAGPSRLHINSSYAKVGALAERFPQIFEPGVMTVGVTDTAYGEDHCWAQYFRRVIDVNSPSPFSPVVAVDSPLEAVHSAAVLTRSELGAGAHGRASQRNVYLREQLDELLAEVMAKIEVAAQQRDACVRRLAEALAPVEVGAEALRRQIDGVVDMYNSSAGSLRREAWLNLRRLLKVRARLFRKLHREQMPLSDASFDLAQLLDDARSCLDSEIVFEKHRIVG